MLAVPSGSVHVSGALSSELAAAKVGSLTHNSGDSGRIAAIVIGVLGAMALVGLIVFRFVRQKNVQQEQEDEESAKQSLPEPLLDEIEPKADNFVSDGA
jgi:flagellar basal body-associated protein FliL